MLYISHQYCKVRRTNPINRYVWIRYSKGLIFLRLDYWPCGTSNRCLLDDNTISLSPVIVKSRSHFQTMTLVFI